MTTPDEAGPDGASGPELDPDVLEELEAWGSDDDEPGGTDPGPVDGTAPDQIDGTDPGPVDGTDPDPDQIDGTAPDPDQAPGTGGTLVLVGTPIGNLGDLSPRAARTLDEADIVYCEDTRHSRKLLTHAGILGASLRSLHEHNEHERIDEILAAVRGGRTVAVVSDAGMPGVSDPGGRVVAAAAAEGLVVTVVPGPSAALAALVASGLPTDRFVFEGFLPRSGRQRKERLAEVASERRTTVLFEAPGRVPATVRDLSEACGGDRPVVVARELTKLHEALWRGSLSEAIVWTETPLRGEVVLVLGGASEDDGGGVDDEVLTAALSDRLSAGERTRGVVDEVAAAFGVPRRRVYELALAAKGAAAPTTDPG